MDEDRDGEIMRLVPVPSGDANGPRRPTLRAHLLGPFVISLGDRSAGPWPRPAAKRLCELVLLSPGRRLSREAAIGTLFANLGPGPGGRALSQALSNARAALAHLGGEVAGLLQADRTHIWADPRYPLVVDLDIHEESLRRAREAGPGTERDDLLVAALADDRALLENEPLADWALLPRERLEWARQEARLALARDRARGLGRSAPQAVVQAWEACLSHDPTSEEATSALVRLYEAQGRPALAEATYRRCRAALDELGLRASPALEQLRRAATPTVPVGQPLPDNASLAAGARYTSERRLVTVFAELAGRAGASPGPGPEDLHELVGGALAGVVAQVEALGGAVTSVSGAGLGARRAGYPHGH